MTHYQVSTLATTTDSSVTVDIQFAGTIVGVQIAGRIANTAGQSAGIRHQLSFGSTPASTTNDARQVVCNSLNGMPSNAAQGDNGINLFVPMALPVGAGERLYLHTIIAGTAPVASSMQMIVMVDDKNTSSRFLRS